MQKGRTVGIGVDCAAFLMVLAENITTNYNTCLMSIKQMPIFSGNRNHTKYAKISEERALNLTQIQHCNRLGKCENYRLFQIFLCSIV